MCVQGSRVCVQNLTFQFLVVRENGLLEGDGSLNFDVEIGRTSAWRSGFAL